MGLKNLLPKSKDAGFSRRCVHEYRLSFHALFNDCRLKNKYATEKDKKTKTTIVTLTAMFGFPKEKALRTFGLSVQKDLQNFRSRRLCKAAKPVESLRHLTKGDKK